MQLNIVHLDLDAFFCAVEEWRNPSLRGLPFAVGGRPESRGVVASCSYAARKFGVRSAMPMAQARILCPDLIILSHRHGDYSERSRKVMALLTKITDKVEQLSIDEAFLDAADHPKTGEEIAHYLQRQIQDRFELPCSFGVATNKLVAKIATDVGKASFKGTGPPNAITIVPAGQEAAFLKELPVEALWGVGPKTAAQLAILGITEIGELADWPVEDLMRRFGKHGYDLSHRSKGIDKRQINRRRVAKSVSKETTFARDIRRGDDLRRTLRKLSGQVATRLQQVNLVGPTVKLKIRWPDFTTLTRQSTLVETTNQVDAIYTAAETLFDQVWQPGMPVRLIGVGVSNLSPPIRQLSLWESFVDGELSLTTEKERRLQAAINAVQERLGPGLVQRGLDSSGGDF